MAFVLLNNGNFFRIAKTQSDINDINIPEQFKTVVDISDEDFNSYVTNQKEIIVSDGNVSFQDIPNTGRIEQTNSSDLTSHFERFKNLANLYIGNNSEKQLATQCQNYLNYLNTVDMDSLSFPLNWEKHCLDNSIVFLHKDQIG
tara:strand:- start:1479 stop:1910 length:432 start_codon:yes stop_codon:yes gene_type:complete